MHTSSWDTAAVGIATLRGNGHIVSHASQVRIWITLLLCKWAIKELYILVRENIQFLKKEKKRDKVPPDWTKLFLSKCKWIKMFLEFAACVCVLTRFSKFLFSVLACVLFWATHYLIKDKNINTSHCWTGSKVKEGGWGSAGFVASQR